MRKTHYSLKLLTPAFLGDANQSGVWRTPPFKALLREWWRVVAAPTHGFEPRDLREAEGRLLGNAWLDSGATQSKVRLALKHWDEGTPGWESNDPSVLHPEVKDREGRARQVGSQLYLGYGPLVFKQGTALKNNAALQAGKTNELSFAWPDNETAIPHALQLIDWFGTIGGRSRNGWGSLALGLEPLTKDHAQLLPVLRDIRECLKLDWPHAIGKDASGVLIWESVDSFADWKAAMTFLAKTKIGFRVSLGFTTGNNSRQLEGRHIVAYPVTNHSVTDWGRDARLANQLRFKLFLDPNKKLRARIYHTPHKCPLSMPQNLNQLAVWQKIHGWLDSQANLQRLGAAK